jgi:hypothetical protein
VNNKFLVSDNQIDAAVDQRRGTVNAKPPVDMRTTSEPSSVFVAEPRVGMEGLIPAGTTSGSAETEHREIRLPAADATEVVREVAELTHDFRLRERSSVEVKFNFKDETELSVRLAYRDGDVHTMFRTDSPELRAALGREWNGYAVSFAQEQRGFKIADPVFTSSGDFSGSSQGRDTGSSAGGDARQQQHSPHPDHPGSPRTVPGDSFRSPSAASSRPVLSVGARVPDDRLLHVFA